MAAGVLVSLTELELELDRERRTASRVSSVCLQDHPIDAA